MRVFPFFAAAAIVAGLTLSACGTTGGRQTTYGEDLDRLTADCTARGGVIAPSGANRGRAETDYLCRISGGATRIERQN